MTKNYYKIRKLMNKIIRRQLGSLLKSDDNQYKYAIGVVITKSRPTLIVRQAERTRQVHMLKILFRADVNGNNADVAPRGVLKRRSFDDR